MTAYGLYVFDRHCTCTFYANYAGKLPVPGLTTLPNVYRPSPTVVVPSSSESGSSSSKRDSNASSLPPWERNGNRQSLLIADDRLQSINGGGRNSEVKEERVGLAFDEEAKLVYGIVFSLRNLVQKLASREDDAFHSFSTSAYKLHYLRTPSSLHFVLVTSPMVESLRSLLQQIYSGPFTEFVVRNPLVELDSFESGKGFDNDAFRAACDRLIKGI